MTKRWPCRIMSSLRRQSPLQALAQHLPVWIPAAVPREPIREPFDFDRGSCVNCDQPPAGRLGDSLAEHPSDCGRPGRVQFDCLQVVCSRSAVVSAFHSIAQRRYSCQA
jgi:hypothetical protein